MMKVGEKMRIIFSRKGFDSGTGCIPSPIMPDGAMISLPIPDRFGTVAYGDLTSTGHRLDKIIKDLGGKRRNSQNRLTPLLSNDRAHLDPDLVQHICPRPTSEWKPALGQCGSAAGVLRNQSVTVGDLFLFFGWFRQCELHNGTYRYVPGSPDIHAFFGYLMIGEILKIGTDTVPDWAQHHPHLHGTRAGTNVLYVAADLLGLPDKQDLQGAGAFHKFNRRLQLTSVGASRSLWSLPRWFYPDNGKQPLSSHQDLSRWSPYH